jgi:hypothetical protein
MQGQVSVFISPWNRVAQLYPQALCTLQSSDWLSLYSFCKDYIENTSSNSSWKFCVHVCCYRNVFTEPLPSKGRP